VLASIKDRPSRAGIRTRQERNARPAGTRKRFWKVWLWRVWRAAPDKGFVYVRSEYPQAFAAMREAVAQARAKGYLRLGLFDVEVVRGAGSYVAGEETSLLRSLAGLRATVRAKPPYPATHGYLGQSTAVNNVESLASAPAIVAATEPPRWRFRSAGRWAGSCRHTSLTCLCWIRLWACRTYGCATSPSPNHLKDCAAFTGSASRRGQAAGGCAGKSGRRQVPRKRDRLEALMNPLIETTTMARLPAGQVEYRLDRRGSAVVVVFHGGHVRAGLAVGEEVFAAADCTVLVPSRPGYGRTPLSTGTSVPEYADVVRALCTHLGIDRVSAVVGISGGGPTAATMAARYPDLVERLILISAVGWLPFPGRLTQLGAHIMFAAGTERTTWAGIRALVRVAPNTCLRLMLRSLSTRPVGEVVAALRSDDRAMLLFLFGHMRSGRGFLNDLRPTPDVTAQIGQPTLVIATRTDRGVPFAHAQSLADTIRHSQLIESQAHTHFVWLGPDWPVIAKRIRAFLDTEAAASDPADSTT